MLHQEIFLFLKSQTWEFYAVEADHSDEALMKCLREKGWEPSGLIYLGRMEGHLPKKPHSLDGYGPGSPPNPPQAEETPAGWGSLKLHEVVS